MSTTTISKEDRRLLAVGLVQAVIEGVNPALALTGDGTMSTNPVYLESYERYHYLIELVCAGLDARGKREAEIERDLNAQVRSSILAALSKEVDYQRRTQAAAAGGGLPSLLAGVQQAQNLANGAQEPAESGVAEIEIIVLEGEGGPTEQG